MDQIAAMRMFVRVVESGSFSAVARETGVGQPAVSKQITALEAHLGTQLLRRTSRSLSLTDTGQDFHEAAVRLLDDLAAAEARVGHGQRAPSGLIRVSVAPVFGRMYIVPRLAAFFARFPEIVIDIQATDRVIDLVADGVDLAIHNGALNDSNLVAKTLGTSPVVTVASRPYIDTYGEPKSPDDLQTHRSVI
jgi:LysR family transcriptional regulator for bpeEF and oprC